MSRTEVKATARVKVEMEILSGSTWGDTCAISQVQSQAVEGALGFLRQLGDKFPEFRARVKIVGEPEVIAVLVEEKKP